MQSLLRSSMSPTQAGTCPKNTLAFSIRFKKSAAAQNDIDGEEDSYGCDSVPSAHSSVSQNIAMKPAALF